MRSFFSSFIFFFTIGVLGAKDYEVTVYTRHQGLPQDYVYTLLQDKKNYLWIGTGNGLTRFDGKNFLTFKSNNGLSEDFITSSALLPDGKHLFSHFNGEVSSLLNGKFSVFNQVSVGKSINKIFYESKGKVWIGSRAGQLTCVDLKTQKEKKWIIGEYESVQYIDTTLDGTLLVGSDLHVFLLNSNAFSSNPVFSTKNSPDSSGFKTISRLNKTTWIVFTQDKNLYLLTADKGNLRFQKVFLPNNLEKTSNFFQALISDKCWAQNQNGNWHEFKFQNGFFTLVSTLEDPLLNTQLLPNQLLEDNEGNIWMGTFGNGLIKLSIRHSTFYGFDKNLKVNSVTVSGKKEILLGTSGGLYVFQKKNSRFVNAGNPFAKEEIVSVTEIGRDIFALATQSSKVYAWNKETQECTAWVLPLPQQSKIRQIVKDRNGNVWLATSSGAMVYDVKRGTSRLFTMNDGLAHNYIYNIFPDSKGRIWFATHKSGLSYFYGSKIVNLKSPVENSGLDVNAFAEDTKGRLWVGTSGQGIFLVNPDGQFVKTISSVDGLSSDYIYFFQKDVYGAVWVGHKNGLDRILTTKEDNFIISDYTQYLAGRELEQADYQTAKDKDVWLAGNNVAIRLNINPDEKLPEGSFVDISGLKLNYQDVNWSARKNIRFTNEIPDYLSFAYNENLFTFLFNGISFQYNDKLRYQYKLEGFDDDWSLLTEQNFVTYNKLPPGDYVFLVRSRNYAGIWSKPTALHFVINPPYWETWWFRVAFVVLIMALVYAFLKIRTANLRKRNEALEIEKAKLEKEISVRKIVENKLLKSEIGLKNTNQELNTFIYRASHDLRGPVSTIWGLINVAKLRIADKESNEFLALMNTSVEKLDMILKKLLIVSEIKQNEIQAERLDINEVLESVLNTFAEEIEKSGIQVQIESKVKRTFNTDRKLLEIVLKNVVDNSIVYSKKSNPQLNILLNVKQNDLMIQIKDNGTGIKRENLDKVFNMFYKASDMSRGNGLGLYIVKNALLLLDGEIHLSSVENEYTSVEIHIPEFKKNTHAVRRS